MNRIYAVNDENNTMFGVKSKSSHSFIKSYDLKSMSIGWVQNPNNKFSWPYTVNPIFSISPELAAQSGMTGAMQGFFLFDMFKSIFEAIKALVSIIINGIINIVKELVKALAKIDWRALAHIFLVELNPIHLVWNALSTNPLTGHFFRELDKLTGGLFSTVDRIATLPGRALRGDGISKQELIQDAIFIMKVGAIIIAGGTAASIISGSSEQLKAGYLGQTWLGQTLLTIGAATALSYFTQGSITQGLESGVVTVAKQEGTKEVIAKTPLGQTELGRQLAATGVGAAALTGTSIVHGENVGDNLSSFAVSEGKGIAKTAVASEVGGPYANQIASTVVEHGYPPDPSKLSASEVASNVWEEIKRTPANVVNAITNFNISVSKGDIDAPKIDIDPNATNSPRSGTGLPHLALPELNIPKIELPKTFEGWEQLLCKIDFFVNQGKVCALYRRKYMTAGVPLWVYILEDGTVYWTFEEIRIDRTLEFLLYMGIAAAAIYGIFGGEKRKRALA